MISHVYTKFAVRFALAIAVLPVVAGVSFAQNLEPLSQAKIGTGSANITQVTLVGPTQEYRHFVLARNHEAKGFVALKSDGTSVTYTLPSGLVFEDRVPRLADMTGDGHDEIILVMSSVSGGAALAIFEVQGTNARLLTQTPHIGLANRWLNPAGIADFDGDGRLDIALVQMPHLVKRLEVWTLNSSELVRTFAEDNVSNHRGGSPHQGLSAHFDFDNDGLADLIVPDGSRQNLRVISFASGTITDLASVRLSARADGDFIMRESGDTITLSVPLESGETDQVQF